MNGMRKAGLTVSLGGGGGGTAALVLGAESFGPSPQLLPLRGGDGSGGGGLLLSFLLLLFLVLAL
jgi:hypothetical protein